ncbi:hypothetical protein QBC42DRAFT_225406 [Cladorrhinum samala]|uniref:Transmembrane protein n=1 Tax=Cladorrhinum samala TaxID=585594 RepID=A0AAV9HQA3_9PEZI|nr:hypothetical protein QBC42DRAFT_225406 [Cladorrhinum samala]
MDSPFASSLSSRIFFPLLCFIWMLFILALTISLSILGSFPSSPSACKPDNSFSPFLDDYKWWSQQSFFEITLRGGSLTFGQAKAVDVIWDLAIGRGGQALASYISWQVFTRYLAVSLERAPVTYSVFRQSFLQRDSSISSAYALIKELRLFTRLPSRTVKAFMAATLTLIIVFPTLIGAMTGYTPKTAAFVRELDGNAFIKFSDFGLVSYIVHDGWRIGKSGNLVIPYRLPKKQTEPVVSKLDYTFSFDYSNRTTDCDVEDDVEFYVRHYGFYGVENTRTLVAIELPAPALNVSTTYRGVSHFAHNWNDPRTGGFPFQNKTNAKFVAGNQTYGLDHIMTHGRCQPISDQYQWGFSFLQLFIVSIILLIWTIGISILWLKAEINLPLSEYQSGVPQGWECILHIAKTMGKELEAVGIEDTKGMTDSELRDLVSAKLSGGQISFGAEMEKDTMIGLREWARCWWGKEKCWTTAFGFHCGVFICAVIFALLWRPTWPLSVIAALACILLYVAMLLRLTKLMWVILPWSWLAFGITASKVYYLIQSQAFK